MKTRELLEAVKTEFPNLDVRTLSMWVKKGYLQAPTREAYGYKEGLSEYEWDVDTVKRLKVMGSACGHRVTDKAAVALMSQGYFIGADNTRRAIENLVDSIIEEFVKNKPLPDIKCAPVFSEWSEIIFTSLLSPWGWHLDSNAERLENPKAVDDYSPISHMLSCFSLTTLVKDISGKHDLFIETAFNMSANIFNHVCPIIGRLHGRSDYPVISVNSYTKRVDDSGISKLPKIEFECTLRLIITCALMSTALHKDELKEVAPHALTHIFAGLCGCDVPVNSVRQFHSDKTNLVGKLGLL